MIKLRRIVCKIRGHHWIAWGHPVFGMAGAGQKGVSAYSCSRCGAVGTS